MKKKHHVVIVVLSSDDESNQRIIDTINRYAPAEALAQNDIHLETVRMNDPRMAWERLCAESGHVSLILGLEDGGGFDLTLISNVRRALPHVPIVAWGLKCFEPEVRHHGIRFVDRFRNTPPTVRIAREAVHHLRQIGHSN